MGNEDRRAKVTPETKAEAARLAKLWSERSHPSQAEFGETYGIGNQSAVGQFLRGNTPLSLKAARGFAMGLNCRIEDFSPRLAAEAAQIASMVPSGSLSPELADLAAQVETLPTKQRDWVLMTLREAVKLAHELATENAVTRRENEAAEHFVPSSSKRRRAA
jgi:hypothetical protein